MTTLTVDLDGVAANWRLLEALHGRRIAAVVKADAYGLGAVRIGACLHAAGARHFFVAYPQEGQALRPHVGRAMIGILNGFFSELAGMYVAQDLAPVLGTLPDVAAWSAMGRQAGRRLPALLHVDTGMNRLGLSGGELATLAQDPERLDDIEVLFVMSHLANAELPDDPRNAAQLTRVQEDAARLPTAPRSLANSSALFLGGAYASDLARPGAALYGINPTPGHANPMRPVMRLTARVLQLRDVPVGEQVGYNGIWTAARPTRVATVSAGYADGYHRALSNAAWAAFDGARLPLIGRVSMDLTTFDATDHPGLVEGSALELVGPAIPPDEVAGWAGTNAYEVLTSLRPRMGRVYAPL